ncbi:response regulator transcription factor [Candidatus Neomarinimicrobiota bacterium]
MASILIIDDSSFQRSVIRDLMHEAGHDTAEAANGRTGLDLITASKPDCILTDLLMPDMGGLELLEALHEQGTTVPVIIITANSQSSVRQRCLELGAAAVVNKPVKAAELFAALKEVLVNTRIR